MRGGMAACTEQVKIRGQRVELGEIEHHLERVLSAQSKADNVQITAEVIKLEESHTPTLVSFFFIAPGAGITSGEAKLILAKAIDGVEDRLAKSVPPYMVPSAFLIVEQAPLTPTGKLDRKSLREQGPRLYRKELQSQETLEKEHEVGSQTENTIHAPWWRLHYRYASRVSLPSRGYIRHGRRYIEVAHCTQSSTCQ
jgi:hypothetical protein